MALFEIGNLTFSYAASGMRKALENVSLRRENILYCAEPPAAAKPRCCGI